MRWFPELKVERANLPSTASVQQAIASSYKTLCDATEISEEVSLSKTHAVCLGLC